MLQSELQQGQTAFVPVQNQQAMFWPYAFQDDQGNIIAYPAISGGTVGQPIQSGQVQQGNNNGIGSQLAKQGIMSMIGF